MSTLVLTIRDERGRTVTSKLKFSITLPGREKRETATRRRNDKRETIHIRLGSRKGKFSVTIQEKNSFKEVVSADFPINQVVFEEVKLRSKWQIPPASALTGKRKALLQEYLKRKKFGGWKALTEEEQTTYLAITKALSQVQIGNETAIDHIAKLKEIAGDPSGKRGNAAIFRLYTHQTDGFNNWITNGARYVDHKKKPRKTIGAKGHKGYPKSRKTIDGKPNFQWSYTEDRRQADIDLDGLGIRHLTRENSDVRAWYERFKKKYGNPGFVRRGA